MRKKIPMIWKVTWFLITLSTTALAQPTVVTTIPENSTNFVAAGDYTYFTSGDALWRTDGTADGTMQLVTGIGGAGDWDQEAYARAFQGMFYFVTSDNSKLWRSDGTTEGTILLHTSAGNTRMLEETYDYLFFATLATGTGYELYRTDGSAAGTILLKDVYPGPETGYQNAAGVIENEFLFRGNDPEHAMELWKSNGTPGGTALVKEISPEGDGHWAPVAATFNSKYFFVGTTADAGSEPWVSDGTSEGTFLLKDIVPGNESPRDIQFAAATDELLFFLVFTDEGPVELWKTAGTTVSTEKVKTVWEWYPDETSYQHFLVHENKLYFFEHMIISESENVWVSDGTAEGTRILLNNHWTVDGGISYFEEVNDHLLFTGEFQGRPSVLERLIEGSRAVVHHLRSNYYGRKWDITNVGELAFFADHDQTYADESGKPEDPEDYFHLYQTDGLTARSMRTLFGVSTTGTGNITDFNGKVIFTTQNDQEGSTDLTKQLWIYDPTEASTPACTASGTILREHWSGVSGTTVPAIPVDEAPTSTSQLTVFEAPSNIGDNYGARIRGYICPPATGAYTFWIASNDHSELWLSTDDNPANRVRIANLTRATNPREWTKFPSQRSAPVELVAGKRYYIEALHKEGIGTDHIAVGWQLPDGTMERPIAGSRLSPANPDDNTGPIVSLTNPTNDAIFTAPADITITADASDADGVVAKVEFFEGANLLFADHNAPFSFAWNNVSPGTYTLTARATDNSAASTTSEAITITVAEACTAFGIIKREVWRGVQGTSVSEIPLNTSPDAVHELTTFEGPTNSGTNYGARIRGYICPPATGGYTFWIASNDHSELWISTDDNPANKVRIAWLDRATGAREWNRFATQRSAVIQLQKGRTYYIEALHKQGIGGDHLAVGWQLPDGTLERPIAGSRLSPFEMSFSNVAMVDKGASDAARYSQISVYPNPAQTTDGELTISGYEGIEEIVDTQVQIVNMTGEVVFSENVKCGGDCGSYLLKINKQLVPGLYMVNLKANGVRLSKRLLVE